MMLMVMPITMAMMMFSESKRAVGMMHGPSVPPQDPTLPPTMANSPFYMTDGSGDDEDGDQAGTTCGLSFKAELIQNLS